MRAVNLLDAIRDLVAAAEDAGWDNPNPNASILERGREAYAELRKRLTEEVAREGVEHALLGDEPAEALTDEPENAEAVGLVTKINRAIVLAEAAVVSPVSREIVADGRAALAEVAAFFEVDVPPAVQS